jgi:hypothetical protein
MSRFGVLTMSVSMAPGHVDIPAWFFRLATWDGLLPACVVLIPTGVGLLMPNSRGAMEVVSIALPIAAFFIRAGVGKRYIASNGCGVAFRCVQYCVFCVGILLLVFFDAVLILSRLMPKGALFAARSDVYVWAILFSLYLTSMAIALYPGRAKAVYDH